MKTLARGLFRFKRALLLWLRSKFWSLVFKECGWGLNVYGRISVRAPEQITLGHHCRLNEGVIVVGTGPLTLGSHVHIAGQVVLATSGLDYKKEDWPNFSAPIVIHDFAWVGAGSRVRPGITIGEGAIVGMGSVVTHDVAPYTVVAGVPARVIGSIEQRLTCTCKKK